MSKFVCKQCNAEFKYQSHYERHLNRKTPCKVEEKVPKESTERCKYCKKGYMKGRALQKHEKQCRFKDDDVRALEMEMGVEIEPLYETTQCRFCKHKYCLNKKMIQHMGVCKKREEYKLRLKTEYMEGMRHVNNGMRSQNNTQNAQVINNNCSINNNIMIQMVPFGKENFDYIEKDLKNIMKCLRYNAGNTVDEVKNLVIKLIKKMHGHKDHPENHNVLMDGKNKPHATVYTENGFERRCAIDVSQELVEQAGNYVCDEYDFGDDAKKLLISERLYNNTDSLTVSADKASKASGKLRSAVKDVLCDQITKELIKSTIEKQQLSLDGTHLKVINV